MIVSENGQNVWHCWGGTAPSHLYVVTRNKKESDKAMQILKKLYGNVTMSWTAAADAPLRWNEIETAYIHSKLSEIFD